MNSKKEFSAQLEEKVLEIEEILKRFMPEAGREYKVLEESMSYSLFEGGKRLRPMLMRETYRLFGGEKEVIFPFMAAIEMIHTYSLIHDDLPAMDNDDYRRGRLTSHKVYGEDLAILAGDGLLNLAFEAAASAFSIEDGDPKRVGRALQILANKAGMHGMIGGQVIDVTSVHTDVSEERLLLIYRMKTAALLEAAMMIGAVLAGADEEQIRSMEQVARDVGIAFQIQDDILDITGDPRTLGKPVCSDEKNAKTTYVAFTGVSGAAEEVSRLSNRAVAGLQSLPGQNPYLERLLLWLICRDR